MKYFPEGLGVTWTMDKERHREEGLEDWERNSLLSIIDYYLERPQERWRGHWTDLEIPIKPEHLHFTEWMSPAAIGDWEERLQPSLYKAIDKMFREAQIAHEFRRAAWTDEIDEKYEAKKAWYDRQV